MGQLISRLKAQQTTTTAFRVPMSTDALCEALMASYEGVATERGVVFVADDCVRRNVRAVASVLSQDNGSARFGLRMSGLPGNGKTTMLWAIYRMLKGLSEIGIVRGRYSGMMAISATGLIEWTRKGNDIPKTPMIMSIDDFGKEPAKVKDYGNVVSPMVDLIEHRYNNRYYTILTTNLNPKEILSKYGRRIDDRFREMFDTVVFENPTYRR